jgi:hypothetical protein
VDVGGLIVRLAQLSSLATARTAIVLGTLVFACNLAADAMRASADLPSVQGGLVTTVSQAFEPTHVSVWVNVS